MNKAILSVFTLAAVVAFVQSLPMSNEGTLAIDEMSSGGSQQSVSDDDSLLVDGEQINTRTKRCICHLPILGRILGCYTGDRKRYKQYNTIGNGRHNHNIVHNHYH